MVVDTLGNEEVLGKVKAIAWTDEGRTLISARFSQHLKLVFTNIETGVALRSFDVTSTWDSRHPKTYLSKDGHRLACGLTHSVRLVETSSGSSILTLALLRNNQPLFISSEGHFLGPTASIDRGIVYVTQSTKGQQTLEPSEFQERYGWKNDPSQVTAR